MPCRWSLFLAALCSVGCAPDLRQDFPFDGELAPGTYLVHEDVGGGFTQTEVDASHNQAWIYLDFDDLSQVPASEAAGSVRWELAFQRFKILSNGGSSGVGEVAVARLEGQRLRELQVAPSEGFEVDRPDGPDANSDVDSAFLVDDGWYAYDLLRHRVTPRPDLTFVVRSSEGRFVGLQLLGYYDEAGSAAHPRFEWKWLPAP